MSFSRSLAAHYEERGAVIWLAFALELIAAATLFFLMLLTCTDVAGRYFFSNAVDGATELTEIGLAIMVFAEMPVVTWRGGHVIVDILDRYLSGPVIKVLSLISAFLISTSLYFIAVKIYELADRSLGREEITEYLELPVGYILNYIAVMSWLTAGAMITYGVYRILTQARD